MENSRDPKVIAIAILALALIIVGGLYIKELRKPDSLTSFQNELAQQKQALGESCGDLSTEANRAKCSDTLENLQGVLGQLKGTETETATTTQ